MRQLDRPLGIVGAGAIGLTFGAALASAGEPVTLIARRPGLDELRRAGEIVLTGELPRRAGLHSSSATSGGIAISDDLRMLSGCVAIIFTVKAHQLADVASRVARQVEFGDDTQVFVAGLQNGVVKDELLAAAFGPDRVVGSATVLNARRRTASEVSVASMGMTWLGEFGDGPDDRLAPVQRALAGAGIPCEMVSDIASLTWTKLANAAGAFGVSSLTRLSGPQIMSRPPLVAAYRSLLDEVELIATAEGVRLGDFSELPIRSRLDQPAEQMVAGIVRLVKASFPDPQATTGSLTSMAQDVIAGRHTESEMIFGDLVRRATRHGLDTPCLSFVGRILSGLDDYQESAR